MQAVRRTKEEAQREHTKKPIEHGGLPYFLVALLCSPQGQRNIPAENDVKTIGDGRATAN
jgi:hypothetical protein